MSYTGEQRAKRNMDDFGRFKRGVRDCRDGVPHRAGQDIMYDRGYSAQYQIEQANTAKTIEGE